jgi:hypothetical protein
MLEVIILKRGFFELHSRGRSFNPITVGETDSVIHFLTPLPYPK